MPDLIERTIAILRINGERWQALATEIDRELLARRPEPGEWSVLECFGHLLDSEYVVSARVRWILAEDEPDIVGYDQALWVAELEHNEDARGAGSQAQTG